MKKFAAFVLIGFLTFGAISVAQEPTHPFDRAPIFSEQSRVHRDNDIIRAHDLVDFIFDETDLGKLVEKPDVTIQEVSREDFEEILAKSVSGEDIDWQEWLKEFRRQEAVGFEALSTYPTEGELTIVTDEVTDRIIIHEVFHYILYHSGGTKLDVEQAVDAYTSVFMVSKDYLNWLRENY